MTKENETVEMTDAELNELIAHHVEAALAKIDESDVAEIEERIEFKLNEMFRGGTLVVMSPDEFRRTLAEAFASEVKNAAEAAMTRMTGNPGLYK